MKVTVCELKDHSRETFNRLKNHLEEKQSELLLLPEMPFSPWIFSSPQFNEDEWKKSLEAHHTHLEKMAELVPSCVTQVIGSIPREIPLISKRLNSCFHASLSKESPHWQIHFKHDKVYLPNDEGFYEASWYDYSQNDFVPFTINKSKIRAGVLICTELWFMEHAREYGEQGIQLLLNPRSTEKGTVDKWLTGGRAAAVISGAYCLSSNLSGGQGYIISPDGEVLGKTSEEEPFLSLDIDLSLADKAKKTYPRYVFRPNIL
jgi:N-carbamoylputrescine amidase